MTIKFGFFFIGIPKKGGSEVVTPSAPQQAKPSSDALSASKAEKKEKPKKEKGGKGGGGKQPAVEELPVHVGR